MPSSFIVITLLRDSLTLRMLWLQQKWLTDWLEEEKAPAATRPHHHQRKQAARVRAHDSHWLPWPSSWWLSSAQLSFVFIHQVHNIVTTMMMIKRTRRAGTIEPRTKATINAAVGSRFGLPRNPRPPVLSISLAAVVFISDPIADGDATFRG